MEAVLRIYGRVFSIRNSKHASIVLLVSPNAPRYYRAQPATAWRKCTAHALLFTPEGGSHRIVANQFFRTIAGRVACDVYGLESGFSPAHRAV